MIAGSALTAGMFGVGLAPAAADTEENPEETVEETDGEAGTPGEIDEDSEENSEEGGTEDDGAEDAEEGDVEDGADDLPVVTTPAPEERPEVNPEFDELLVGLPA